MRATPDPGDLAFLGSTFVEERDGRALVRLPNGSKTSVGFDALRPAGGPVHFVDTGSGQVAVHCGLCDWSDRTTRRVLAEDAWMVHFREHDPRGRPESPPISDAELDEMARRADATAPASARDFVGHTRQDVPRLVAEVRRLQRKLAAANRPEVDASPEDA